MSHFDAVVLAGDSSVRLGGLDKPMLIVGGRPLLLHVLDAVRDADRRVVVGPVRAIPADFAGHLDWCREDPPGGGPVAAIAAAMPLTGAGVVVLLAADLPQVAPAVPLLIEALTAGRSDVAALRDASGRINFLACAWRRTALVNRLEAMSGRPNMAMRTLFEDASMIAVDDAGGWSVDCDTWDDVARARRVHRKDVTMVDPKAVGPETDELRRWATAVSAALELPAGALDVALVLDLARDAAHNVARPAAPLTTFLVGLAAGLRGGSADAIQQSSAIATTLSAHWTGTEQADDSSKAKNSST
ncbi:MAG TPA: NTP transferase domain-containing protein [Jatrophihabitantaceae bacterium]|jgi:molybdopterin-guanine dinucleotide biosynthesis protein A|nr:NTP transferase domain-containing protein [Jatrophihabitantaceae bacterium]